MNTLRELFEGIKKVFEPYLVDRRIVDVDSWSGAASNYSSTAEYCNACLINLNEGDSEDWTQADCKLPVRREEDSSDTFVRQAVFAAAARFNQVDAPAEALESARRKLLGAYEEMGEDPPEALTRAISGERLFNALWERMFTLDDAVEGSDHYLIDMYFDEGGIYALYVDRGKLYRYPVMVQNDNVVLGERQQVMEVHQPVGVRTVIRQQEDGRYRWFSVSGTAVLNRSGDIDSRELFDSFIAHAEETGEYPIRQFFHAGEAYRTGQADFLARDGFCYITSGLYDDTPLAQAEVQARQNNPGFWGDSIGFIPTAEQELTEISDGIKIPVYRRGINKEISTLPENEAAHLFTRTEVTRMSLDSRAWEAFVQLWDGDEEKARQWLEENPEARNRAIEEAGMITRDGGEELNELMTLFKEDKDKALEWLEQHTNDPPPSESDPPADISQELEIDESVIEAVGQNVLESEPITQLSDRITQLETQQPEVAQASEVEELRATIDKLTKRLEALEKGEAVVQQQRVDDTPAKFNGKQKVVYRPRLANAALQEDGVPYSEKAKANMPKGAY
jgi:hypothetical protein